MIQIKLRVISYYLHAKPLCCEYGITPELTSFSFLNAMKCPDCQSQQVLKNGHRKERQCYRCKQCGRQFLESYRPWTYSPSIRQRCINMHLKGIGLRKIERITSIHHTTVLRWVREMQKPSDLGCGDK